ncbi:ubiquitin carboxyl-terminal hydrolase 36-like [Petromyzon marinus]|uniref:ubiquitin carboxyl-terminal hydrolase 36-like n=1 Tax=Petromyzon marinus TaxID=7757 RepID=UPI003F70B028
MISNFTHCKNGEGQEAKSIQQAEADTISSIVVKDEASTSPPAVSAADDKGLEIQHSTVPSAVSFVTESSTTGLHKPNAGDEDSIPSLEFTTPATDNLVLKWQEDLHEGAGLNNLGNTCFVNASLQGLTYTAPLANFLLYSDHSWTCKQTEFCMMCLLEKHVFNTFMNRGMAIDPIDIVLNFKNIGEDLCFGRQEDAHVFLSYVIDTLHQSCLFNQSQLNIDMETPTLIHQIFRGYLKSRVECTQCFSISDTLDSCLDISLNINKSLDLVKALYEFTKTENLSEYRCGMCSRVGKSTKRVSLHVVPNVLIVTIKRYDEFGHKIDREFLFPEKLDIRPFMSSQVVQESQLYSLYSVIVHHGTTTNSGHYYSYNKVSNGSWFRMDDADVEPVAKSEVLQDQAYILFYMRSPE